MSSISPSLEKPQKIYQDSINIENKREKNHEDKERGKEWKSD